MSTTLLPGSLLPRPAQGRAAPAHLLGTVQRATLTEWVRRENAAISSAEIESFYVRGEKPVGVLRVLRALERQLMRHADDPARLTREYRGGRGAQRAPRRVLLEPDRRRARQRHAYADGSPRSPKRCAKPSASTASRRG
ncbi:MAG: hypothetical protein U1F49_06525 [Rubrivivax sp.]